MNEQAYRQAERDFWAKHGLTPSERFVRLPRIGTTVRVQEVGEGPPALFVHGGPNSGATWAPLLAHLDGFRCLLVDRPGTGLSEPYPVTAERLAGFGGTFVGDVLDGLGVERAHVVASSFGGHIALRSAAAEPERFRRMVQMACPALAPGEQTPPFLRLLTKGWIRTILNVLPPNPRANRVIMRQIGHEKSLAAGRLEEFLAWYLELQRHTDTMRNDGEMISGLVPERPRVSLTDGLLRSIPVPTLFLWGEDDTFGGETVARHVTGAMQDAELVMIPDAGHLPWLDDPVRLARATAAFLTAPEVGAHPPVQAQR